MAAIQKPGEAGYRISNNFKPAPVFHEGAILHQIPSKMSRPDLRALVGLNRLAPVPLVMAHHPFFILTSWRSREIRRKLDMALN